jgi:hypothetical protein
MRRRFASLLIGVAVIQLMTACAGKQSARTAIAALKKVQAATETGVNYQQYGQLLIEAKTAVNEASSKLPDGELKTEMEAAMEAYTDAGQAWGIMLEGHTLYSEGRGAKWDQKYSLGLPSRGEYVYDQMQRKVVVSQIWEAADAHLNRAAALL